MKPGTPEYEAADAELKASKVYRDWADKDRSIFRALPGYPWLPCPICGGTESCDDTVRERALAAHPNLILSDGQRQVQ